MFLIGAFSKITQVSISQLRYYDEIDLFKPAHTDPDTGYRYYSTDQLPRLNRILALKEMGLALDQIKRLLKEDIGPDDMRGMLRLKLAQMEQALVRQRTRLALVESRIDQIDQHGQMPLHEVVIKSVPDQHFLAVRQHDAELGTMGQMFFVIHHALEENSIQQHGDCMAVFHDPVFKTAPIDWEVGFLVPEGVPPVALDEEQKMVVRQLPGVDQMATFIHRGHWGNLHQGYSTLGRWMEIHGYRVTGPSREVFLRLKPPPDNYDNITEIQFPVENIS